MKAFAALLLIVFGILAVVGMMYLSNVGTAADAQRLQALADLERVRGEAMVNMTNARTDAFVEKSYAATISIAGLAIVLVAILLTAVVLLIVASWRRENSRVDYQHQYHDPRIISQNRNQRLQSGSKQIDHDYPYIYDPHMDDNNYSDYSG